MRYEVTTLLGQEIPAPLREISDPPEILFVAGNLPDPEGHAFLAVVGSRQYSPYGEKVCESIIAGLRGYPIVVVSGLALGIDAIAHRAALARGLLTIAVPGSGLDPRVLYPRTNHGLAESILRAGGALVSEFEPTFRPTRGSFEQRNRIMAGLCRAVLIVEAEEKSGTMITARLATDYNRDVLTVPGSIFSRGSAGPHLLIRLGATPVRNADDVLDALGLARLPLARTTAAAPEACSPRERAILELIATPCPRDEIIRRASFSSSEVNAVLTALEIKGLVVETAGELRIAH